MLETLVCVERIDGKYAIVFYPFVGCDISEALLLNSFSEMQFAIRFRKQFIETMRTHERNN